MVTARRQGSADIKTERCRTVGANPGDAQQDDTSRLSELTEEFADTCEKVGFVSKVFIVGLSFPWRLQQNLYALEIPGL